MRRVRVIPTLLLQDGGLVKSIRFKEHRYLGDPINAVRIFNEKLVDELVILDISATVSGRPPDVDRIRKIVSQAFMPVAYGGGISSVDQVRSLIAAGVEKVIINTEAFSNAELIRNSAALVGSQSIVGSVDVRKTFWSGKKVWIKNGSMNTGLSPVEYCLRLEELGVGEILLNSVDRDGTFGGYDLDLIEQVTDALTIPVVAIGGANHISDFEKAIKSGASAVAAGSMFVYKGPFKAVLISYLTQEELMEDLYSKI